jgi:hypothetical protein
VDSCETTVGIVLGIDLHLDASGAELCGHLVQISHAKVDHPGFVAFCDTTRVPGVASEKKGEKASSPFPLLSLTGSIRQPSAI